MKKIIWKIKLDGFGDQKSNKKLPFLYKAAWVNKKQLKLMEIRTKTTPCIKKYRGNAKAKSCTISIPA